MSLQDQALKLIEQAETAIRADNQQYAIELLRQSILYNGKNADAYILLGIALAQTKAPADAETAFVRATQLAPESVKAQYNLAVHQYSEGQLHSALESARTAQAIDVRHKGSAELVSRIERELGLTPGQVPERSPAGNVVPVQMRPGYEEVPMATMPFVERLGPAWNVIGWTIAFISLAGMIYMLSQVIPAASASAKPDAVMKSMSGNASFEIFRMTYFSTIVLGIVWTAMDAIHRRGNLLWVLPQVLCGCVGFTWLVIPIYYFVGRNKEGNEPTSPAVMD